MMPTILQVALGGALGASGRYLAGVLAIRLLGPGFPWATIGVNILGSLAMGLFVAAAAHRGLTYLAPFVMTGILGGFTTFSAFSLDVVTLWERGAVTQAAGYAAGSVILSLGALVAGLMLGRAVFA